MNLENNGERMDINYYNLNYNEMNIYQKSHFKRYEFAKNLLQRDHIVGDMACGTGYGSMMLSEVCKEVYGVDIDENTINEVKNRYKEKNINFHSMDLLDLHFENLFDVIVSFETVEHFEEKNIHKLINKFHKSLNKNGILLFSTPYDQQKNINSMRWHKTFNITEQKIKELIDDIFKIEEIWYQDYETHDLKKKTHKKDFIICKLIKI